MKNLISPAALVALFVFHQLIGCANVLEGSMEKRIRLGDPDRVTGAPEYEIQWLEEQVSGDENSDRILEEATLKLRVMRTEITTTRTPRTEESIQLILPFSPFRESLEFVSSPITLLWALFTFNGNHWFAMINPALNSEAMWKNRHVERIAGSHPIESHVEVETRTDRIGTHLDLQLDTLPPLRVSTAAEGAETEVVLLDLLTAPLFDPPATLTASLLVEGRDEATASTRTIDPGLGKGILQAQRFLLDPSSGRHTPSELAVAVLRLSELGFVKRSASLRSKASLIFGSETVDREIASETIRIARNLKNAGSWAMALEKIEAARALDGSIQREWDQLEADVLEKRALEALGAGRYDRARAGLLRATTIDPGRQERLAAYITMSIEASDRATERRATQASREAFLAIERERADTEAELARSNAARLAPGPAAGVPSGGAPPN
ncbi:MAG: hypothetical protein GY910_04890 [bacterium]|nr:hypothetical protein [Deltaproteobacteria bacterium]MCP4904298.1 hypothetical protein [bacterium]